MNTAPSLAPELRRPVTFADVAMQFVRELPYLMALAMIGVAMITGKMQAVEGIIGILGTHAARGYPHRGVAGAGVALVMLVALARLFAPELALAAVP